MTPGETNAEGYTGYLTNAYVSVVLYVIFVLMDISTLTGLISQANNGTTIILEHRFFGLSNPIDNLEDESLELLTIDQVLLLPPDYFIKNNLMVEQATKDLTFFANNVVLPQPGGDKVGPTEAPWVLAGGSYSGEQEFRFFLKVCNRY